MLQSKVVAFTAFSFTCGVWVGMVWTHFRLRFNEKKKLKPSPSLQVNNDHVFDFLLRELQSDDVSPQDLKDLFSFKLFVPGNAWHVWLSPGSLSLEKYRRPSTQWRLSLSLAMHLNALLAKEPSIRLRRQEAICFCFGDTPGTGLLMATLFPSLLVVTVDTGFKASPQARLRNNLIFTHHTTSVMLDPKITKTVIVVGVFPHNDIRRLWERFASFNRVFIFHLCDCIVPGGIKDLGVPPTAKSTHGGCYGRPVCSWFSAPTD